MAHVEDRWYRVVKHPDGGTTRVKTELFGKGLRYRVRYIDPNGKERGKSFPDRQKRAAEDFMVDIESAKLRGTYLDPIAGRIAFAEYAGKWLAQQTFDLSSREVVERRLRLYVLPHLGHYDLDKVRAGHIREMDRALQVRGRSSSLRAVVMTLVGTILSCAVDDEFITKNPCQARSLRRPKVGPSKVIPWTHEQVTQIRVALPKHLAVTVDIGAGAGLRQGEIFGLGVDGVDTEHRVIHVVRQVKVVGNRLVFALPKGRKTRDVPLSDVIAQRIAAHRLQYPSVEVTLPWERPGGKPVTVELIVTTPSGTALRRGSFNEVHWRDAVAAAGLVPGRASGMHALRHYFASVLLDAGESIKALAVYLGHADPGFTLRTYTHLMPNSEERTRKAIDRVFGDGGANFDGLATA